MTKQQYAEYLKTDYWKNLADRIRAERSHTCQDCDWPYCGDVDDTRRLEVHHTTYERCPYNEQDGDLLLLCEVCHRRRHGLLEETLPTWDLDDFTESEWSFEVQE